MKLNILIAKLARVIRWILISAQAPPQPSQSHSVAGANNKKHPGTLLIALSRRSLSEDCILPAEIQRKREIQLGKKERHKRNKETE